MSVLVIDDLRTFDFDATYARTSAEALAALADGCFEEVWFDHDLGGDDTTIVVLDWVAKRCFDGEELPFSVAVVHTANPVGRDTLVRVLRRWGVRTRVVDAAAHLAPPSSV